MPDLTRRQRQVLEAIERCTRELGYPPTVRELAYVLRLNSTSTVHDHLERLRSLRYVTWDRTCARTLQLTTEGRVEVLTRD